MSPLEELTYQIILELSHTEQVGGIRELRGKDSSFLGFISTGDGRQIILSSKMERLIAEIAGKLRQQDYNIANSHTENEWNWLVRSAFGPALGCIDFENEKTDSARNVIASVQTQLAASKLSGICEHSFGCTLFANFDVAPFSIGPVLFEPRDVWLTRKVRERSVSKVTARRIEDSWQGRRLAKRKPSVDAMNERDILDAVGNCAYVSSVRTQGLASEAGRVKAQKAAHMALAAVALTWEVPSAALSGFRLLTDAGIRRQQSLVFIPGNRTLSGSRLVGRPHGPSISPADWLTQCSKYAKIYEEIGEAIGYLLSPSGASTRPKTMNLLSQALLWFFEACREEVDLMAIVKFTATLDALATGGKSKGIRRLINKQIGIQDDQPIREGGPTLKAAVEEIYGQGRSRTIHGTNDRIGHDWSSIRSRAEAFARHCLILSANWIAENRTIDAPIRLQQ
jgi:hypothetical protein